METVQTAGLQKTPLFSKAAKAVFRLNSDKPSVVAILRTGDVLYLTERDGLYYSARPIPLSDTLGFYVVAPKKRRVARANFEDDPDVSAAEALLPWSGFVEADVVEYLLEEMKLVKIVENNAVALEYMPNGQKLKAKAVRFLLTGMSSTSEAMEWVRGWRRRYPTFAHYAYATYDIAGRPAAAVKVPIYTDELAQLFPPEGARLPEITDVVLVDEGDAAPPPPPPPPDNKLEQLLQEARKAAEEAVKRELESGELMKVRLVAFDLPTEYRGAVTRGEEGRLIITFKQDPAKFRTLRSRFYRWLWECAYKTKAGWVLYKDPPRELGEAMRELNKLAGTNRAVEIIEVYVPKKWLREELSDYVKALRVRVEEMKKRVVDKAVSEATRRVYAREAEKLARVLRELENLLAKH